MISRFLYVYIIKCSDNTYYTGVTKDPDTRFDQHSSGINKECYTYSRRPLQLVFVESFSDFKLAIEWEKKIKRWSQKKKEALIAGDWKKLETEAECKNSTSHKRLKNGGFEAPTAP